MAVALTEERCAPMSVRRLAEVFEVSRETVSRRLAEHEVKPWGDRNGHPIYKLRDAAAAILATGTTSEERSDPLKMKPTDRHAFFKAENERLNYEKECGKLVLASEVEFELRALVSIMVRSLETLPDRVERDARCTPEVTEYLLGEVRAVRAEMAKAMRDGADEDVRESA